MWVKVGIFELIKTNKLTFLSLLSINTLKKL